VYFNILVETAVTGDCDTPLLLLLMVMDCGVGEDIDFLRIVRGEPNIFWFGDHASITVDAIESAIRLVINIVLDIMMMSVYIKCKLKQYVCERSRCAAITRSST
jgi:hypothetical protein